VNRVANDYSSPARHGKVHYPINLMMAVAKEVLFLLFPYSLFGKPIRHIDLLVVSFNTGLMPVFA
jgi:hypothetical protein